MATSTKSKRRTSQARQSKTRHPEIVWRDAALVAKGRPNSRNRRKYVQARDALSNAVTARLAVLSSVPTEYLVEAA